MHLVVADRPVGEHALAHVGGRGRRRARCTPPRSTSGRRSTAARRIARGPCGCRSDNAVRSRPDGERRPGPPRRRRPPPAATTSGAVATPIAARRRRAPCPASSRSAGGRRPRSCWAFVIVGFIAVWKTSRELGLQHVVARAASGEPQPAYVTMLPFVAADHGDRAGREQRPPAAVVSASPPPPSPRCSGCVDLDRVRAWPSSSWPSPAPARLAAVAGFGGALPHACAGAGSVARRSSDHATESSATSRAAC